MKGDFATSQLHSTTRFSRKDMGTDRKNVDLDIVKDKHGDLFCLHALFFHKLKVSAMEGLRVGAHDLLVWRNGTEKLWMAYNLTKVFA